MDDAVLDDALELLLRDTKRRLDLVERVHEVLALHAQVLDVVRDARERADLDMARERERCRALHEPADLRAREVLRERSELNQVHVAIHDAVLAHLGRVDVQDLHAPLLIRERDLHVHLETARAQERLVDHVEPVRHADNEDVVQLVHTVHLFGGKSIGSCQLSGHAYLGEKLVDDAVAYTCASSCGAALLADCVQFVEDDDVQATLVLLLLVLCTL